MNSDALISARTALSESPAAADFTWRSTCSWVNGTYSQSTVTGFSGLGQEHTHRVPFTFDADHPACFASEDRGAAPVEIVLAALGSCLTAGVAAVRGSTARSGARVSAGAALAAATVTTGAATLPVEATATSGV